MHLMRDEYCIVILILIVTTLPSLAFIWSKTGFRFPSKTKTVCSTKLIRRAFGQPNSGLRVSESAEAWISVNTTNNVLSPNDIPGMTGYDNSVSEIVRSYEFNTTLEPIYYQSDIWDSIPLTTMNTLDDLFKNGQKKDVPLHTDIGDVNTGIVRGSLLLQNMNALVYEMHSLGDGPPSKNKLFYQTIVGNSGIGKSFGMVQFNKMLNMFNTTEEIRYFLSFVQASVSDRMINELIQYCSNSYASYITFNDNMDISVDIKIWQDPENLLVARILYAEFGGNDSYQVFINKNRYRIEGLRLNYILAYIQRIRHCKFYTILIDEAMKINACQDANDSENSKVLSLLQICSHTRIMNPTIRYLISSLSTNILGYSFLGKRVLRSQMINLVRMNETNYITMTEKVVSKYNLTGIDRSKAQSLVFSCGGNPKLLNALCDLVNPLNMDYMKKELVNMVHLEGIEGDQAKCGDELSPEEIDRLHNRLGLLNAILQSVYTSIMIPIYPPCAFDEFSSFILDFSDLEGFMTLWSSMRLKIEYGRKKSLFHVISRIWDEKYSSALEELFGKLPVNAVGASNDAYQCYDKSFTTYVRNLRDVCDEVKIFPEKHSFSDNYGLSVIPSDGGKKVCCIIDTVDGEPAIDGMIAYPHAKKIVLLQEKLLLKTERPYSNPKAMMQFKQYARFIILSTINCIPFLREGWSVGYHLFNTKGSGTSCDAATGDEKLLMTQWETSRSNETICNVYKTAFEEDVPINGNGVHKLKMFFAAETLSVLSDNRERYSEVVKKYDCDGKLPELVAREAFKMFTERSCIVNSKGMRALLGGSMAFLLECAQGISHGDFSDNPDNWMFNHTISTV